ncbi:hypothetical protein [Rhodococcus koreensis]|uniref:hypothetical protein n=1 Tax=Rhodococcus koreensis TaxID=99653 RepID=UPI001FC9532A|nr:hypothetical protein [Rhodococcus koreensis]
MPSKTNSLRLSPLLKRAPERAVAGIHQIDRGMDDGAEGVVEVEFGCDGEHRLEKSVDVISGIDDLRDAFLHLGQQLAEPQFGQGTE